jgi:hypothetical protein
MQKFLFYIVFSFIVGGLLLHFDIAIPGVSFWLGKIPGDFSVIRGEKIIPVPIVSAAILGSLFTLISFAFSSQKKDKE